jgi:hypothetical protein
MACVQLPRLEREREVVEGFVRQVRFSLWFDVANVAFPLATKRLVEVGAEAVGMLCPHRDAQRAG